VSATFTRLYRRYGKRLLDLGLSASILAVASPLLTLIAAAVRLDLGRPVLFRQQRLGFLSRPFVILKFRTMRDMRDPSGQLLPDAERLTPLGRLLRTTSLDELPELINILKGEMSLVGPRPLLVEYLDRYTPEQMRRHEVLPGLTGWAQINGRNALSWEERFKLDLWYISHHSLALDLQILLRTLGKALNREGISHPGQETMPRFDDPTD
jgi:sugar transferase EpsL